MQSQISKKKRFLFFTIFAIVFLVAIPVVILYSTGYTIDGETFSLTKRGGIYMFVDKTGSEIYIEDEHKHTTGIFQKEILVKNLKPDTYLVVVSNDQFQPWAKFLAVKPQEVTSAFPILVPREIRVTELIDPQSTTTVLSPEVELAYESALSLFEPTITTSVGTVIQGSSTATTTVTGKRIRVFAEGGDVYAEWTGNHLAAPAYFCREVDCQQTITVFSPNQDIAHIDFYPGREDVIVLAFGNGIYAVEIDNREYQNFYSLFKGKAPDFRIERDRIYVQDGDFLGVIELDV